MSRHVYKPMLAKVAEEPFSGKNWIFEVKWDGFRAIAYVEEPFSLKSRNGTTYSPVNVFFQPTARTR